MPFAPPNYQGTLSLLDSLFPFLTEFLPAAFNPQGRSFWYKLMNMNEQTTGKGPTRLMSCSGQKRKGYACPFKSLRFQSKKISWGTLAETPVCVCVCVCGGGRMDGAAYTNGPQTFWHQGLFHGRQFFYGWVEGDGFRVIQAHYIYCALPISNPRPWPRGGGPLVYYHDVYFTEHHPCHIEPSLITPFVIE